MTTTLLVESENTDGKLTIRAEIRHGPRGQWFVSEIDIVQPFDAGDLPTALRQLAQELDSNLAAGASSSSEEVRMPRTVPNPMDLANAITKALFPEIYGKSGISTAQVAQLMGARGIIYDTICAATGGDHRKMAK